MYCIIVNIFQVNSIKSTHQSDPPFFSTAPRRGKSLACKVSGFFSCISLGTVSMGPLGAMAGVELSQEWTWCKVVVPWCCPACTHVVLFWNEGY